MPETLFYFKLNKMFGRKLKVTPLARFFIKVNMRPSFL